MIRFKDKIIEEYSICPLTGEIFDKDGVVQKTYLSNKRLRFKQMPIHCIMAHTFYGWRPGNDVHHIDENPLNNMLSNLDYSMTRPEHASLTNKGRIKTNECRMKISVAKTGKPLSEEHKANIKKATQGDKNPFFGKHHSQESKEKNRQAHLGKRLSKETIEKQIASRIGRHWWNNGTEERFSKDCPGPEWKRGRLSRS